MEKSEHDDIFQECDNMDVTTKVECKKDLAEQNFKDINLEAIVNYKQNNNRHVVPVGVLIVLITIYLGMTSVQKCLVSCVENTQITGQISQNKEENFNYLKNGEILEKSQILERLLEYKDICKDLEVFTKDIMEQKLTEKEEEKEENYNDLNEIQVSYDEKVAEMEGSSVEAEESYSASGSGSDNGNDNVNGCAKFSRNKHKKSKYSIKTTNNKNGFNKYNKSTKAKHQKSQKKELNLNKKNSTAEPIIYLFALVFIYLLLKAASDINQHYKSQNKNDKRLRRCSLQSYAQTHRPDRRASKGISAKSLPKF